MGRRLRDRRNELTHIGARPQGKSAASFLIVDLLGLGQDSLIKAKSTRLA